VVHSCAVASQVAIQAGLKSARPSGPNGPEAEARVKTRRPLGDQLGSSETTPDGCPTGVHGPDS